MSRRLKVQTKEMGPLELYLIHSYGKVWESYWRPLQGSLVKDLFTHVEHDVVEHALIGWSKPLVVALGRTPDACLLKLPSRECAHAGACSFHHRTHCLSTSKKMPWCFEPDQFEPTFRRLVAEAIGLWREGVYVTVVEEPQNAG